MFTLKATNFTRIRLIAALFLVTLITIVFWACNKTDKNFTQANDDTFTTAVAKEWWYAHFNKTALYRSAAVTYVNSNNAQAIVSSSAGKKTVSSNKYPYWKKAVSFKKDKLEWVEMPLFKEYSKIPLPGGMGNLSAAEKKRVAQASLNRVLLIRKPNGKVLVRQATIIPTADYARSRNYDISNFSFGKTNTGFNGYVYISDWKSKHINSYEYKNGVLDNKLKLIAATANGLPATAATLICDLVWVPNQTQSCVTIIAGDEPGNEGTTTCGEYHDDPTGAGEWQDVCVDDGNPYGGEDDPCIMWGIGCTEDEDLCTLYGIDCPGDEDVEDEPDYTCPDNFTFVSVTNHDLWQEAILTDVYCNLLRLSGGPKVWFKISISELYFGVPYYNVEGNLVYSKSTAQAMAADAINRAEFDMRKYFARNNSATYNQLQEYWINKTNEYMKEFSSGRGKAGKTGSSNPKNIVPPRKYEACQ